MPRKRDPLKVECLVSGRWLQFPQRATDHPSGDECIWIEVMTEGTGDYPRKLCTLFIQRHELIEALHKMKKP